MLTIWLGQLNGLPITSTITLVPTGIPQSSIAGPLLFNIFTNDIVKASSKFAVIREDAKEVDTHCEDFTYSDYLNTSTAHRFNFDLISESD